MKIGWLVIETSDYDNEETTVFYKVKPEYYSGRLVQIVYAEIEMTNPVGWTDDQMIRFGSYIISPSLSEFSYEERLEIFRQHELRYNIKAPVKSKDELEVKNAN